MSKYVARLLYDHPERTEQVQVEVISSYSIESARSQLMSLFNQIGWDYGHCYSNDCEYFQPLE